MVVIAHLGETCELKHSSEDTTGVPSGTFLSIYLFNKPGGATTLDLPIVSFFLFIKYSVLLIDYELDSEKLETTFTL